MFNCALVPLLCIFTNARHDQNQPVESMGRGAQLRLTRAGLQYVANVGVQALQKKINNLHIPNMSGGGSHFTWDASNVYIKSFQVGAHSLTPVPNVGIKLSVRGITVPVSLHAHAKYRKHFIKVSTSTNVDATAIDASLDIVLKVDATNNGKPHVTVTSCSGGLGHLQLHFHGGQKWLWTLVAGLLKSKLTKLVKGAICSQSQEQINKNANKFLATFPTRKNIKKYAYIDYSLSKPAFTNDYMDFFVRGEFLNYERPVHSKLQPPQFQTTSSANKMVYFWLTDYSLNTAAEVFHNANLLSKVIKVGDKIPPGVKPFLNTGSIKKIIPQLYKKYPDLPMQIDLETFKAPFFQLQPGQASISVYVRAGMNVELKNKTLVNVFHLDISVAAKGEASTRMEKNEANLVGKITSFNFKISVGGSSIGKIDLPLSNPIIQNLVEGLVVEQANPLLNKGFPLPQSQNLLLRSPSLTIVQNAIRVDADVEYHP